MNDEDFIYVPAAQRNNLDDIILRVQAEKDKGDVAAELSPPAVLEETLRKLDINAQMGERVTAMQAEFAKKKKPGNNAQTDLK